MCSIPVVSLTACFGLPPPLPRSFWREAGQPGYPRKRSQPDRAETGPLDRLLRPRAGWLGRDGRRGKSRKEGAGVQARGAGRCSRSKARARSRPKDGRRHRSVVAIIDGETPSFLPFHKDYLLLSAHQCQKAAKFGVWSILLPLINKPGDHLQISYFIMAVAVDAI